MVSRVSTAGSIVQNLLNLRNNAANFDLLSYRIATGKNFQQLRDYGTDATRLVDLRQEIASRDAYVRSITMTSVFTNAYDASLDRLADITQDLLDAADPLSTQDTNWTADSEILANNMLLDAEANLNVEIGGRYLFAGSNYTVAPVNNLRNLNIYPVAEIGTADTIESFNQVPEMTYDATGPLYQSYHSSFAGTGTLDSNAWEVASLTISDGQTVDYGITATDEAFQLLVDGLMRFKSATATGLTEDERKGFLAEARNLANTARDSIRQLQSANGIATETMTNAQALHGSFIDISLTAMNGIEVADTAEAATRLSILQTQMQASYSVIAKRQQLSLVNFL